MPEVIADKTVEKFINNLTDTCCGLILGCQNSDGGGGSRSLVIRLVSSPDPQSAGDNSDALHGAVSPARLSTVQPKCIAEHAKQVVCLLPGGVDIIGVFVCDTSCVNIADAFRAHEEKLLSACAAIYRTLDKLTGLHCNKCDRLLLSVIEPRNCKMVSRYVSVTPSSPAQLQQRNLQWQFRWLQWTRVQTRVSFNSTQLRSPPSLSSSSSSSESTTSMFQLIMSGMCECVGGVCDVSRCCFLVNGDLCCDPDTPLLTNESSSSSNPVQLDILTPLDGGYESVDGLFDSSCSNNNRALSINKLEISGTIHCEAFVQSRATVGEAVRSICCDLRRSVHARVTMHCDSLVEEPNSLVAAAGRSACCDSVLHELPRRVLAPLLPSGGNYSNQRVLVSDYLYPGDTSADSLQTLCELFAIEAADAGHIADHFEAHCEDMTVSSECSSTADQFEQQMRLGDFASSCGFGLLSSIAHTNTLIYALAAVVGCCAVAIIWLNIAAPSSVSPGN